jgi:putative oxidoreductase
MKTTNEQLNDLDNRNNDELKITRLLIDTNNELLSTGVLLLRCVTGIILFVVGSGKVFGWFGGFGIDVTLQFYLKSGIAYPFAYMSIFTEFIGGILFTIGLLTRLSAIAIIINMLVATILMFPNGFLGPNGASYPFMFLVIVIAVFITGPLALSIDSFILNKNKSN